MKERVVNLLFEERLVHLVDILHKIVDALASESIPYELIGGMAVVVQIERVDPDQVMLTRDVDLMVRRSDLERIIDVAKRYAFHFRHVAGLDMLLYGEERKAMRGVHLVFSGEKVKQTQVTPNPQIQPERVQVQGKDVWVIPLADLVRMKLSSYRLKDQVHVQAMDAVGLITPAVEQTLPQELYSRLRHIRETE
jgi:hypothetical protein